MIREHKMKNVLMKAGYRGQIQLNFVKFMELIPNSTLISELQFIIFGYYVPQVKEVVVKKAIQKGLEQILQQSEPDKERRREQARFSSRRKKTPLGLLKLS